jgi:dUTP pyrophosphatase
MALRINSDFDGILDLYSERANHGDDAGLDLYVVSDVVVPSHGMATLDFKVYCERVGSKAGYMLVPRSSISKTPLRMANSIGIIDAGYRGHIMAKVDNISDKDYHVKAGERLFQICMPDLAPFVVEIGHVDKNTVRGTGGFGSTN